METPGFENVTQFFYPDGEGVQQITSLAAKAIPQLTALRYMADEQLATHVRQSERFAALVNDMYFVLDTPDITRVPLLEREAYAEVVTLRDDLCERLRTSRIAKNATFTGTHGLDVHGYSVTLADGQPLCMTKWGYASIPRFMQEASQGYSDEELSALKFFNISDTAHVDWARVKRTYRQWMRYYHPDMNSHDPDFAKERTTAINNAYDNLRDRIKEFDRKQRLEKLRQEEVRQRSQEQQPSENTIRRNDWRPSSQTPNDEPAKLAPAAAAV